MPKPRRNLRKVKKNKVQINKLEKIEILEDYDDMFNALHSLLECDITKLKAITWIRKCTDCIVCAKFIVEMTANACCRTCLFQWVYEVKRVCPACKLPVMFILKQNELMVLCAVFRLDDSEPEGVGHYLREVDEKLGMLEFKRIV